MDKVTLSGFSVVELNKLLADVDTEIARREKAERDRIVSEMKKLASSIGIDLDTILEKELKKKSGMKTPLPVKYRDSADDSNKWTGKGPQPRWLKDAIASGKRLQDFLVSGT